MVEGNYYYYCKNSECQALYDKEIKNQEQENEKSITINKYGTFGGLWRLWNDKEKFQGITVVIIINAAIALLLGIIVLRYYMINTIGNGSVVLSNSASSESYWQLLWGICFIGIALIVIIISTIKLAKKKEKACFDGNIRYSIGWISAISVLGIIAMIVYFVRRQRIAAWQALLLSIVYMLLVRLVYSPSFFIEVGMSIYPLINPFTSAIPFGYENFVHVIPKVEIRYFIIPTILVCFFRSVGIWLNDRRKTT
ncbi:MAG: hypothetical protein PHD01_01660 [Geobacteraceae bacterium]|nr:hypothetical protein [Geobacteraceae bacterium]